MNIARLSLLGTALLIAACSGGGDSFVAGTQPSTSLKIDSTNAIAATRASYSAAEDSSHLAGIGGAAGLSAGTPDGSAVAQQVGDTGGLLLDTLSLIPFGPDVYPCAVGLGTVTISGDIAVPGTLTPGDTFRIEYELCDEGAGEVIDGIIDLTVAEFSGDFLLQSYRVAMNAVVTDLQVATPSDTVTGNGDATITLDTRQAPYIEASVSGTQLTTDTNSSSETLSNYSSSQTFDGNLQPPEYTLGASGTLDSTQLAGIVTYATSPNFIGLGEAYPHSGTLLVTGDSSSARLVAVDDTNVRIDIDLDGDGVIDESIDTTWDALTNPNP